MKTNDVRINYNCGVNFHFCLENGSKDYLFVLFKSPCTVYTLEGYFEVEPGSFALFDRNVRQEYFCGKYEFVHDYVRFEPDEEFAEFFHYNFPMNRIFKQESTTELESLLKFIAKEFYSTSKYRNEAMNLFVKLLLIKVKEYSCNFAIEEHSKRYMDFLELRSNIYSNPQNYISIEQIAKTVHLSKSHFQILYKEYFKISCINDVIIARTEKAKLFITNTDKSISEISFLCGYSNIEHFIRQFKKIVGITPTSYRKKLKK